MGIKEAKFITSSVDYGQVCPVFRRTFEADSVQRATLTISALGLYEATLNGKRIGDYVLAPGWTRYDTRLQYQTYDITTMLQSGENILDVTVGQGWCVGRLTWEDRWNFWADKTALIARIELEYMDGRIETIRTDETWLTAQSNILMSQLYFGETYDARVTPSDWTPCQEYSYHKEALIPQEGEIIREIETLKPIALLSAPNGDTLIDFGQNMTGYVQFRVKGAAGEIAEISHAEILDKDGNFYTENLRDATQKITYICDGNEATFKPHFTFQGFRYVRVDRWPEEINLDNFTAIVVHSDMKRTGHFTCSNEKVNRLYENVIWGQKGNFVDVPTDCPQRDERLGWLGDAQVFIRTAAYNFDVQKFFKKWLHDLRDDQFADGGTPAVVPDVNKSGFGPGYPIEDAGANSAAWGDAATVCPWEIYLAYGDKEVLEDQFDSMRKWVEYIRAQGDDEFLWNTGDHYGDWLGLDSPPGSYKGITDEYLIATGFYAYSTSLLIKAGKVLGKDMAEYERLYQGIREAFNREYVSGGKMTSHTQTAYIVALYFDLVDDRDTFAKELVTLIRDNGNRLKTGFVGTAYLMLTLSQCGYHDVAYSLLLQEEFPSWLYSVNMGATTIWEHWDGMRPDGTMWSADMNSFNHYSYGAVAAWMYGYITGIRPDETKPGYEHFFLAPVPDARLEYAKASLDTKFGTIRSEWETKDGKTTYRFAVPAGSTATIVLGGKNEEVGAGEYKYTV